MQSPVLTDGVIVLRQYKEDDVPRFHAAVRSSALSIGRWMDWCHANYSLDEARSWLVACDQAWATDVSCPLLITDAATQQIMGTVDINQINRGHNFGNLGYWVVESCTRRGVATSAARLLASYGFEKLGISRLEIVVLVDNIASRRVAEKAGAQFECIARNRLVAGGRSQDAAIYSLLATDLA